MFLFPSTGLALPASEGAHPAQEERAAGTSSALVRFVAASLSVGWEALLSGHGHQAALS